LITIEKSGKTVEDAVEAGLRELGKTSSDVTIEVLHYGSPGLFGMFGKLAKVRLTVKEKDADFDFDMPVFTLNQQDPQKGKEESKNQARPKSALEPKAAAEPKPKAGAEQRPETEPRQVAGSHRKKETRLEPQEKPEPRSGSKSERKQRSESRNRGEGEHLSRARERDAREDLPPTDPDTLGPEARCAYDFLSQLTTLMNVPVEIRVQEGEGLLKIQMLGDTLGVLIGRRGETLDALQYLTSLQVNKGREGYIRVTLDTEHYRARREEALCGLARRMASRARRTGRRVALEPMNPYERRILHSALQDNPHVTTHSEGEEPYRRVIITLK
jgi:spoIIIJ-associated protein